MRSDASFQHNWKKDINSCYSTCVTQGTAAIARNTGTAWSPSLCQIKGVHLSEGRILTASDVHVTYDMFWILKTKCFRDNEWPELLTRWKIHKQEIILKCFLYFHFTFVCAVFCGYFQELRIVLFWRRLKKDVLSFSFVTIPTALEPKNILHFFQANKDNLH